MEYTFEVSYLSFNGAVTSKVFVIITQPKLARKAPLFLNQPFEIAVPVTQSPGSIIKNTNIVVMEAEPLSFYSSGFTLQLLNNDSYTPSSIFELPFLFVKNKVNVIIRLRSTAQFDGQRKYDLIVS
jgi:hypothetical protein